MAPIRHRQQWTGAESNRRHQDFQSCRRLREDWGRYVAALALSGGPDPERSRYWTGQAEYFARRLRRRLAELERSEGVTFARRRDPIVLNGLEQPDSD